MIHIITHNYKDKDSLYISGFIHTRALFYHQQNIDFKVFSKSCKKAYKIEGINVYPLKEWDPKTSPCDAVVLHFFLEKTLKLIEKKIQYVPKIFAICHGFDVLLPEHYSHLLQSFHYPGFYSDYKKLEERVAIKERIRKVNFLVKKSLQKIGLQKKDDSYVNHFLHHYLGNKLRLIFISKWLRDQMLQRFEIKQNVLEKYSTIVANACHSVFFENTYNPQKPYLADFVTMRPVIGGDRAKYGLDIIIALARRWPKYTFHLYTHAPILLAQMRFVPDNLTVIKKLMSQSDMAEMLNHYRAALMPTKLDSQGVSMCEMAIFGIPMIASDISVCRDMLSDFKNQIAFMDNQTLDIDIDAFFETIKPGTTKIQRFSHDQTTAKEIAYIRESNNHSTAED